MMAPEGVVEVADEAEQTLHHRHVQHAREVVVRNENEENVQRLADRVLALCMKIESYKYQFCSVLENRVHGLDNAAHTIARSEWNEETAPDDLLNGVALLRQQGNGIAGFVHLLQQNQEQQQLRVALRRVLQPAGDEVEQLLQALVALHD